MIRLIRGLLTPSIGAVLRAFDRVDRALEKLIQHQSQTQAYQLKKADDAKARAAAAGDTVERATRVQGKIKDLLA